MEAILKTLNLFEMLPVYLVDRLYLSFALHTAYYLVGFRGLAN